MASETPKIVWIEWLDSCMNHGWREENSINLESGRLRCESIGFLVSETDDLVVVSASWDSVESFADPITIPRCSITKMQEVEFS